MNNTQMVSRSQTVYGSLCSISDTNVTLTCLWMFINFLTSIYNSLLLLKRSTYTLQFHKVVSFNEEVSRFFSFLCCPSPFRLIKNVFPIHLLLDMHPYTIKPRDLFVCVLSLSVRPLHKPLPPWRYHLFPFSRSLSPFSKVWYYV